MQSIISAGLPVIAIPKWVTQFTYIWSYYISLCDPFQARSETTDTVAPKMFKATMESIILLILEG